MTIRVAMTQSEFDAFKKEYDKMMHTRMNGEQDMTAYECDECGCAHVGPCVFCSLCGAGMAAPMPWCDTCEGERARGSHKWRGPNGQWSRERYALWIASMLPEGGQA
jgi:hypothetical protein